MKGGNFYRFVILLVCILAFIGGIFAEPETFFKNANECKFLILVGFPFFCVCIAGCACLEKLMTGFVLGFRRIVDKRASRNIMPVSSWKISNVAGIAFSFFGIGMIISSSWMGVLKTWEGLAFLSSGLGVIIGSTLAKRILTK